MDFEQELDSNPKDWDLRLIYSDYLEELELVDQAKVQRWLVYRKRTPLLCVMNNVSLDIKWIFGDERIWSDGKWDDCLLQEDLFRDLPRGDYPAEGYSSYWKYYSSRKVAEDFLREALRRLNLL